jgi:hypothetical protein
VVLRTAGAASYSSASRQRCRRKILVGAAALDLMTKDAAFAAEFTALLNHYVKKPRDRALFDFLIRLQVF